MVLTDRLNPGSVELVCFNSLASLPPPPSKLPGIWHLFVNFWLVKFPFHSGQKCQCSNAWAPRGDTRQSNAPTPGTFRAKWVMGKEKNHPWTPLWNSTVSQVLLFFTIKIYIKWLHTCICEQNFLHVFTCTFKHSTKQGIVLSLDNFSSLKMVSPSAPM